MKRQLKAAGDPERAVQEKRYLKSPYRFYGVSVPATDRIARDFRKANHSADIDRVLRIVSGLWKSNNHDEKRLALKLLRYYPEQISFGLMPVLEAMLTESPTWDLVDEISIHFVGAVLEKDKRSFSYLKKWSRSSNFWMRRASLISQILLFRKGKGNLEMFYTFAERMLPEKAFFIRKAIGWTIRELSRNDPKAAFVFLMRIREKASGLTLREGAKRLPEVMRKRIFSL